MAQRLYSMYDKFDFPPYVFREYPKALRPPSFATDRVFREQLTAPGQPPILVEDHEQGPHAQVIVNNEEEENAVLAMWKEKFNYTPPAIEAPIHRSVAELEAQIEALNDQLKAANSAREAAAALAAKVAAETSAKSKVVDLKPSEPAPGPKA